MNENENQSKSSRMSGGAWLMKSGRRPVSLGLAPADYDLLRSAADLEHRPLTQFVVHHALVAARKIIAKK